MATPPKPYYTLFDTSIGDDPAVVVVNSALRTFKERLSFQWHLRIRVDCEQQGENGMPTPEEVEALDRLEVSISIPLLTDQNAMFLARITARGQRVLLFRVRDPKAANEALQTLTSTPEPLREWDYEMEQDSNWDLAQPELRLLERDPRFN